VFVEVRKKLQGKEKKRPKCYTKPQGDPWTQIQNPRNRPGRKDYKDFLGMEGTFSKSHLSSERSRKGVGPIQSSLEREKQHGKELPTGKKPERSSLPGFEKGGGRGGKNFPLGRS